jgi:hypothetical protein
MSFFRISCCVFAGVGELNVDDDAAGAELDLLDGFAADEILAGVGIDQRTQAGLDVGLGDGHRMLRRKWVAMSKRLRY